MRRTLGCLLLIAVTPALLGAQATYQWTMALPQGQGVFPADWEPDLWPITVTPIRGPGGHLWIVDGHGVWRSEDATRWERVTDQVPWGQRTGVSVAWYQDKLWIFGGRIGGALRNDVWFSTDGVTWHQATATTRWSGRVGARALVFDDKLWLLGGDDGFPRGDVWYSSNGINWYPTTQAAPWAAGQYPPAVVHGDRMFVIGGSLGTARNEVWASSDGREWARVTGDASWTPRYGHGVASFLGRLWVIAGERRAGRWVADSWHSANGESWSRLDDAPWAARAVEHVAVFDGKLWLFAGRVGLPEDRGSWVSDIWYLDAATP